MNSLKKIVFFLIAFVPFALSAQTSVDLDSEFGGRISVGIDKKIQKGLHVSLDEELRLDDNFKSVNRLQMNLGVDYKLMQYIKLGVGYSLINPYDMTENAFSDAKHRIVFSATGIVRYGQWRFALKEQFQLTHRTGSFNEYQNPRNALTLKSRLSAKYNYSERFAPYVFVEFRSVLNAPVVVASYDGTNYLTSSGSKTGDAGWFLDGFSGSYLNRIRLGVGAQIKFDVHNGLNICLLLDRVSDKIVDANAEGTKLKSYTKETGFVGQIGVGYVYSF